MNSDLDFDLDCLLDYLGNEVEEESSCIDEDQQSITNNSIQEEGLSVHSQSLSSITSRYVSMNLFIIFFSMYLLIYSGDSNEYCYRNDMIPDSLKSVLVPFQHSSTKINNNDNNDHKHNHKKRKSTYVRKFPFPKILKRDIRWDIPKMLTNVLNSMDRELVTTFFQRICMPSCAFVDIVPKTQLSNSTTTNINSINPAVYDFDSMTSIVKTNQSLFPDLIVRLQNAEIIQSSRFAGGGSKIVIYLTLEGTKMFSNGFDRRNGETTKRWPTSSIAISEFQEPKDCPSIENLEITEKTEILSLNDTECVAVDRDEKPFHMFMCPRVSFLLNEQQYVSVIEYALTPGSKVIHKSI